MSIGELIFSDRLVGKFVLVGAIVGFAVVGYGYITGGEMATPFWRIAAPITFGVLGLLIFGATMPIIAWYQYYRVQKRLSCLESAAVVTGGLCAGAAAGGLLVFLQDSFGWFKAICGALMLFGLIIFPFQIYAERKFRKQLNVIDHHTSTGISKR